MVHTLKTKQFINSDLNSVWQFMSSPQNLARITPGYMGFDILSDKGDLASMYPGQIIEYKVSPVLGIKMHWVTEITHVIDKSYFVDEQRMGPYAFWHHKHFLKAVEGGVEMTDIVHYKLPMGFLGRLLNRLFVHKKLKEIFDYRFEKVNGLFNK